MKREKGTKETVERPMSMRERLCKSLDIPPDLFFGQSLLELRGRESMSIKGCGRILLYTPEEIRIALKKGCLRVCGKRLVCTSYHAGAVGIDGAIETIAFEEA